MANKHNLLPFKVDQMAESRSFIAGFRGAWFRCKIKEIGWKKGHIGHALEFYDFPDEKIKWTQIYQKPPIRKTKSNEIKRELMVRPPFPQVYRESQMVHFDTISEETVIVDDVWKVGDLVDWWTDGCYWSGTVTQLLSDDKVKIQLPDPPLGEGLSYDVCCKDLRPSLEWSPEHGWTVPVPKEGENRRRCAQLIQPVKHAAGGLPNLAGQVAELVKDDVQATAGSLEHHGSFSSHISASSLPPPYISVHSPASGTGKQSLVTSESKEHAQEANMDLDMEDFGVGKTSCSDSVSSSLFKDASESMARTTTGKDQYCNDGSSKKMRSGGSIPLNSERSDTLEAAILDLEELANKVRWLKGILKSGTPSNAMRPSWKFVEHRSTPPPKLELHKR